MITYLIAFGVTLVAFTGIDFIWLSRMGDILYRPAMGDMVLDQFRPAPALIFYVIYAFGLVFFAVRPALASGEWTTALLNGAMMGLVAYATYDLTNQATLKNWSNLLTFGDLTWGTVLSGVSATIAYQVTSMLTKVG